MRPQLEVLEDRTLPSASAVTSLPVVSTASPPPAAVVAPQLVSALDQWSHQIITLSQDVNNAWRTLVQGITQETAFLAQQWGLSSVGAPSAVPTQPFSSALPSSASGLPSVIGKGSSSGSSSSSPAVTFLPQAGSDPQNEQIYDTAGTYTWTAPAGVTDVTVQIWGAGGGGGGGGYDSGPTTFGNTAAGYYGGGGGGGGAYVYIGSLSVTPGTNYSVVVGAGGAGGASDGYTGSPGGSGGNSVFGAVTNGGGGGGAGSSRGGMGGMGGPFNPAYLSDVGGYGGNGAEGTNAGGGGGGAGGNGSGPNGGNADGTTGGVGGNGHGFSGDGGEGGGANNLYQPSAGQTPGGGGGGGGVENSAGEAGAKGGDGEVIISWASPGTVSGEVWLDNDGDGSLDNGELGFQGITVKLDDPNGNQLMPPATTDANGNYQFLVPPSLGSQFEIQVVLPDGDDATTQGADSDIDANGYSPVFALAAGGAANVPAGIRSTVVTTTQDDFSGRIQNQVTLRDAINTVGNGLNKPITFKAGVNGTISLQAKLPDLTMQNITIDGSGHSITVQGNGNANNSYRIFTITAAYVTAEIDGLTITGGYAAG
ncbi:MAG TPA: SdrD B-like domain-containing protein, partial [Gemmataceae bacterium]